MTSVAESEANVHVVGVEGSSDDLDVPMEACFRDSAFKARHALGSVNSVNVVRLLVQSVHFFFASLQLDPTASTMVEFAVPCGVSVAAAAHAAGIEAEPLQDESGPTVLKPCNYVHAAALQPCNPSCSRRAPRQHLLTASTPTTLVHCRAGGRPPRRRFAGASNGLASALDRVHECKRRNASRALHGAASGGGANAPDGVAEHGHSDALVRSLISTPRRMGP